VQELLSALTTICRLQAAAYISHYHRAGSLPSFLAVSLHDPISWPRAQVVRLSSITSGRWVLSAEACDAITLLPSSPNPSTPWLQGCSRLTQLKNRLGDQRGGSEWEPIKILLRRVELGLCPKSTTKDSHTSLPRSRSHNGLTNPRNKSQTNPTRKHNSKSKRLRQSGKHQADCP
jgi:hypothetical protein